jgi:hypothetical protein
MDRNTIIGLAAAFLVLAFLFTEKKTDPYEGMLPQNTDKQQFNANSRSPLIDGKAEDAAWESAQWLPLDQTWIGTTPTATDFSGRYKILWDENNLYVLAEITDDSLYEL